MSLDILSFYIVNTPYVSYSLIASFCDTKLAPAPKNGEVILLRHGMSFGPCFFDSNDKHVPSCPSVKVDRVDLVDRVVKVDPDSKVKQIPEAIPITRL